MKIKSSKIIIILLLFSVTSGYAQLLDSIDYDPDRAGLELNPLKGIAANFGSDNGFPHSISGKTVSFSEIAIGENQYDWSVFDDFIEVQAQAGRFSYLQVNVDQGKPVEVDPAGIKPNKNDLPQYLKDKGVPFRLFVPGELPIASEASLQVDYNNPDMMTALLDFIEAFAVKYNNDDRVFLVHYGIYGIFGEWKLGAGGDIQLSQGIDWEMTDANKQAITDAYADNFTNTNLLARFPEFVVEPQSVGYSDGLYFGASISDDPNKAGFFLTELQKFGADMNWKNHVIGGEVDPYVQDNDLWSSFPNTVTGDPALVDGTPPQNTEEVFEMTHPTFLFHNRMLQSQWTNDPTSAIWLNGLKAVKRCGYTFNLNAYKLTASGGKPSIEVNIVNEGIAPMYADWKVELGYIDSEGDVVSLGTTSTWNLKTILPDTEQNYRSYTSGISMPDGISEVVIRIVNPLIEGVMVDGVLKTYPNTNPVRFANDTQGIPQNLDDEGWLILGDIEIINGNAGTTPIPVTGIQTGSYSGTMNLGTQQQLAVTVLPINATNPAVTWISNRPSTASVDESGLVTSYNLSGNVEITAYTEDGGYVGVFNILVNNIWDIPAQIEAEHYSNIYNDGDGDPFNDVRKQVLISGPESGQTVLQNIVNETWIEYTVFAQADTDFILDFRAASPTGQFGNAKIDVLDGDGNLLVDISLQPQTASKDEFRTYTSSVFSLEAGLHTIRLDVETSDFDLDWIDFRIDPCFGFDTNLIGTSCDDGVSTTQLDRYTSECNCEGTEMGSFVIIPAQIEAEDFIEINNASVNDAPQGEGSASVIGNINDDTWIEYAVKVEAVTDFILDFRASSPFGQFGNAQLEILDELGNVLKTISFQPETASYNDYALYSSEAFSLTPGYHIIRLNVIQSAFNLNWIEFRSANELDYTLIPALIEAEDYSDVFNVQENAAPAGETGGNILGFIGDDTWMEYAVSVSTPTSFVLDFRASNEFGVGVVNILNEENEVLGAVALNPGTGSYNIYNTFTSSAFTLPAGDHVIRLDVVASAFNLNWIEFRQLPASFTFQDTGNDDYLLGSNWDTGIPPPRDYPGIVTIEANCVLPTEYTLELGSTATLIVKQGVIMIIN